MRYLKSILLLSIFSFFLSSCAIYHHYGPYYGKIIDEETQKPLEGAVVLAFYNTWLHLSPGGPSGYFIDAQEVVTDKNGEFRITSLNAFAFRPLSTFNAEPYFTIFMPRYECYTRPIPDDRHETIGLHVLKTRDERMRNLSRCYPVYVPTNKMKKYIALENVENIELGLGPRPIK